MGACAFEVDPLPPRQRCRLAAVSTSSSRPDKGEDRPVVIPVGVDVQETRRGREGSSEHAEDLVVALLETTWNGLAGAASLELTKARPARGMAGTTLDVEFSGGGIASVSAHLRAPARLSAAVSLVARGVDRARGRISGCGGCDRVPDRRRARERGGRAEPEPALDNRDRHPSRRRRRGALHGGSAIDLGPPGTGGRVRPSGTRSTRSCSASRSASTTGTRPAF